MLDNSDYVTEGTISNIFIVKDNRLKTPLLNEFVLLIIVELFDHKLIHFDAIWHCKSTFILILLLLNKKSDLKGIVYI